MTLSRLTQCILLLFLCPLLSAGEIALKNGKTIHCEGPFLVVGNNLEYKDKQGNLYRIPLKLVNLQKSHKIDTPKEDPLLRKVAEQEKALDEADRKNGDFFEMVNRDGVKTERDRSATITDKRLDDYVYQNPGVQGLPMDSWRINRIMYDIYYAVDDDDHEALEKLIQPGLPLDKPVTSYQEPLLHLAVGRGNPLTTALLLKGGADANVRDSNGDTPLLAALKRNGSTHRAVAQTLLKGGADANVLDLSKTGPLHLVLQKRDGLLLKALLAAKADPETKGPWGDPALITAVHNNDLVAVDLLLKAGAVVDRRGKAGSTALLEAVKSGNSKMVKKLVHHGADINLLQDGLSPLLLAVANDDLATTQTLLNLKASPGVRASKTDSPAMLAVRNGSEEMLNLLLKHGVDVNVPALLPVAVSQGKIPMVRELLAKKADPNGRDSAGEPALVLAARSGNPVVVKLLLKAGADVYLKSTRGYSAYLEAAGPNAEEIKALLRTKFKK